MSIWNRLPTNRLLVDVSLWSADLAALGDAVRRLEPYADMLHVDVTDAHFVPGLLFFPDLLASLKPLTQTPFHVHLMVDEPVRLIGAFIDAGADVLTVHCESRQATAAIKQIRERGLTPGIAVSLDTSLDQVAGYLPQVDHVLMMGTPLGVKGVDLAPNACRRIREMRRTVPALGHAGRIRIGADGGLRRHTVPDLRAAGVDFITPGSLIFGSSSLADVFRWLWSLP
jgi:ribulose-phosphate 3-epimerase